MNRIMKKISVTMVTMILCMVMFGTAIWAGDPEPETETETEAVAETEIETETESQAEAESETEAEAELITVEEPLLTEDGNGYVEWIENIPIDAADVKVTDAEVEGEVTAILSGKKETETDEEYIQKYSSEYLPKELHSMEELREYVRDDLYHSKLQAEIYKVLEERVFVDSYAEETFKLLKEYADQELQQQVEMYENVGIEGWDKQRVARDLGYASAEDFLNAEAMYYGNAIIMLDYLATSQRITYNDEEVEHAIRDLMGYYGYDDMTVEDYIEMNGGEPWRYMVEKLNVEYHKVLSNMEQYVVFGEDESQPAEETPTQPETKTNESPYIDLTNFTGTTIDDNKVTQDLFSGKDLTILNVWATWCTFCVEEMPELAAYASELPENIQLITFCTDGTEAEEEARKILDESGMSDQGVLTLMSGTEDLETLNSQVVYLPTTLFLNSKGEIIGEAMVGGQQDLKESLDKYVQEALNSKIE